MWSLCKRLCARSDRMLDAAGSFLLVVGGSIIMITVVVQVILRYILKLPLFGLEEFSRLIAVWVYFIGAIFGTKYDSHVQGDVAARLFSTPNAQAAIKVITWVLSALLCFIFLYHSTKYSIWLYGTGERTTGLWWPRIYTVGSMVFGAFFMTLYSLANIVKYGEAALVSFRRTAGGAS
ncbi:MAG: TRAP transporter small permease subunit [Deltaproteobacteria bacterium]|nr:TRAP transporter small permease subunit [Deltaproteobacteria bacterium]